MKKYAFCVLITILFSVALVAQNKDFRNITWGMSPSEVLKLETSKVEYSSASILGFSASVAGFDARLGYEFSKKYQCTGALYLFEQKHSNPNDYINDYDKLKSLLTKVYGAPKNDAIGWKNNLYKDQPEYYGTALLLGHVIFNTGWENENTTIRLILSGDNLKIKAFSINYKSKIFTEDPKEPDTSGL